MQTEIILWCLASALVAVAVTWVFAKAYIVRYYATTNALNVEVEKNKNLEKIKHEVLNGSEFSVKLENEYRRGKEEGQKTELQNFAIVYEPYQDTIEEYMGMKKRAEVGYDMQLYYCGLPIGQPTRRTTHTNIEFDKERIDKIVNSELAGTLNSISQLILTKGMNAKVLPSKGSGAPKKT